MQQFFVIINVVIGPLLNAEVLVLVKNDIPFKRIAYQFSHVYVMKIAVSDTMVRFTAYVSNVFCLSHIIVGLFCLSSTIL